ncbi:leucine-rich repeat domain-containing protein [Leptospira santarosai]|uniref:leucine-rich repeat domain-containing protein n=1 Tax=Leptospira santarosai TaxID=28183 RepID=UPI00035367DA|nr:leucine-rich repeat domain-containing protein [Leptospira santarosai]EPG84205.1 leucine rich repeat protein [Leptospira santarosai serovar Shermani str. 1342KT]
MTKYSLSYKTISGKKEIVFSIILLYCFGNLKAQEEEKGNYKDLAEALQNPKEVRILDLSENQLTILPKEIGKLQKLQLLDLSRNRLITLPKEIERLQNLLSLDLNENQLTTLPKEIGKLQKLQELGLSGNRLITLPKEIGQLKNLRWLSLKNNTALIPQKNKIQKLLPNTNIDF